MSTPYYLQRAVAATDGIVIQTPAGTFTTGLVDANFTKELSSATASGLSTAGITITEVGAGTNAGVYRVSMTAASVVPTTIGTYHLKVYVTATPTYSYEQIYVVTQTGVPGSTGPLLYTSATNSGRVTDGTNPLSGVTVYLSKGTTYLVSVLTDATGNWSQAFDVSFGTVVVQTSKSGYSQAASTLSVGAATITGPATDLVMTAVSGGSTIAASEYWAHLRRMSGNKTGAQADARITQAGNDALDMLSKERDWSYWLRRGFLSINGPYSTGTVAIAKGNTVVTLTGGTWPTWAASGKLYISNSTPAIDVLSRDSATQITLKGTWNNTAVTAGSYTLFQDAYTLPTNLWRFGYVLPGQNWGWGGAPSPIEQIWRLQNVFTTGNSFPANFGIAEGKLVVYPYPSQDATFAYTYRARPTPLASSSDILDIDPAFKEVLWKAGNYQIAVQFGDAVCGDATTCLSMYKQALDNLASNEKTPVELPGTGDPMAGWPIRGGNGGHLANRWY